MKFVIFIFSLFLFLSCNGGDGCEIEETECRGSKVFVCNSEGDWEESMDCSRIEPKILDWQCCFDYHSNDHFCLPREECELGGDA